MKINKDYLKVINEETEGYRANWLPNKPIELGQIGYLENGVFTVMSSLKDHGIQIITKTNDSKSDHKITSKKGVKISSKSKGKPSGMAGGLLGESEAGLIVELEHENAFVFHALNTKLTLIENKAEIERLFKRMVKIDPTWKKYVVITEIIEAESFTFLNTHEKNNTIELKAEIELEVSKINLAEANFGLSIVSEKSSSNSFVAKNGLAPLYRVMGLKSNWFNSKFTTKDLKKSVSDDFGIVDLELQDFIEPEIYGLFIGIEDTNSRHFGDLFGPKNDCIKMEEALNTLEGSKTHFKPLYNENATKKNIVNEIRNHLGSAKSTDTIIFYFSGHGVKEKANYVWQNDQVTGLECLACYCNDENSFLLADKELLYLFNELYTKTNAHIILIIDSCHSGGLTRVLLDEKTIVKTGQHFFPEREWSNFIFSNELKYEEGIYKKIEIPRHIQLAASESDQPAVEYQGEGIFTKTLISILREENMKISFGKIEQRLRSRMSGIYDQTPKVFSHDIPQIDSLLFLGNGYELENRTHGELNYKEEIGYWYLNLGAINGIKNSDTVHLVDNRNIPIGIIGKVISTSINYCFVDFGSAALEFNSIYSCSILGTEKRRLNVNIVNQNTNDLLDPVFEKNIEFIYSLSEFIEFHPKMDADFDYILNIKEPDLFFSNPNDELNRPLLLPLDIYDESFCDNFKDYTKSISGWHFIKELQNPDLEIDLLDTLQIMVSIRPRGFDTEGKNVENPEGGISIEKDSDIKITLVNNSENGLYISPFYLGSDFRVANSMWNKGNTIYLEKGAFQSLTRSVGTVKNEWIPFKIPTGHIVDFNWEYVEELFQFVVSTENFKPKYFDQDDLPTPDIYRGPKREARKGLIPKSSMDDEPKEINKFWYTKSIKLKIKNQNFNKPNIKRITSLLENDYLADFIFPIYYELDLNEQLQPICKLKSHLVVPEEEKGLWWDFLLLAGNSIENGRRKRVYNRVKKNPNKIRIIAEGDSWFLYPFAVKEIIDHLMPYYAIRSIAAAGDTLENYLKSKRYLKFINEKDEKIQIMLLSGGGNDILGENFKKFINESHEIEEGSPPEYFITSEYDLQLEKLEKYFKTIAAEVTIPIVTHGYDYIIPVDTNQYPKQLSWAGKYMIEKGVKSQKDREKIIVYILKKFNKMIERISEKTPHLYYVDVTGTVSKNEWHDEIHPNDLGFAKIAKKIKLKLEQLGIN